MLLNSGKPKRIVVTADFLRPKPEAASGATAANSLWLRRSVETPLRDVTALPIEEVNWGAGFDTEKFYRAQGVDLNLDGWARLHYQQMLEPTAEQMLHDAFNESLVISCELPMCVVRALTRLNIPVIDTVGYPLRFLEDHLNAWRTNHPSIAEKMETYRFDLRYAYYQAGLIRAKSVWMESLDTPPGTAVLIGQVSNDKALIHKTQGRFLSLADFGDPIEDLVRRHSRVLYKPHPYAGAENNQNILKRFPSIELTSANYYWLASQDNVTDIYAISSGTCSEAPYFGKSGNFFYEPLYVLDAEDPLSKGAISSPIPVAQDWLWPEFWQSVLSPVTETRWQGMQAAPFRANRIRRTLNADWGFGVIDRVSAAGFK